MSATATRLARRVVTPVIETLFPSQCWATGAAIEAADMGLSPEARESIARSLTFPYCAACGMTTGPYTRNDKKSPCMHCEKRSIGVASIARVGTFEPPLSDLVKTLKFQKRWEIAALIAPFMVQAIEMQLSVPAKALTVSSSAFDRACGVANPSHATLLSQTAPSSRALRVDALVPVALHWRRRFARGFNQAEEIARAMGKLTGWKVLDALRRVRPTHEQSLAVSVTERRENLDSAFAPRPRISVAGLHLWLIDDVCTTGATLHASALAFKRLPKEQRPAKIHAAVVCVTDKTPVPEA